MVERRQQGVEMTVKNTIAMIVSKDRAMQLDAVLRSLWLHGRDINKLDVKVLYAVTSPIHEKQYRQLMKEHPAVHFMPEHHFKGQLQACIAAYPYVLFMVDDNLFVKPFSIEDCMHALAAHHDTLGFSLRLGTNTRYCYSMDRYQNLPDVHVIENGFFKWNWSVGECDFGYPLELSSSLYRTGDLLPLIAQADFSNPNTLEAQLAGAAFTFAGFKNYIISHETSVTFCNPVNKVQQVYNNRAGSSSQYAVDELSRMFEQGYRIIVETYSGFTPYACHQEVELFFRSP
jgi:hypothetical protein